jgi:hypothetical protein
MSDEMMVAEKAGMLVGTDEEGAVEVIGWVMAGDEYDLREGETLVTHHKTAEKLGVGDMFKEMKAENAPTKAKKEKAEGEVAERKPRGPRVEITKEMDYTVIKADFDATTDEGPRGEAFRLMMQCTNVGKYLEVCNGYEHEKKDGTKVTYSAETCLRYGLKRGAIALNSAA